MKNREKEKKFVGFKQVYSWPIKKSRLASASSCGPDAAADDQECADASWAQGFYPCNFNWLEPGYVWV